jgi:hypothetical protein
MINDIKKLKCKRCQSFTKKSNQRIKCKKFSSFNILNRSYCNIHANHIFKNNALIIQKIYRGYKIRKYIKNNALIIQKIYRGHKIRKYIKNIYKPLPDDLQKKIIFYIRKNYLIKKHHYNIIRNILDKKLEYNYIENLEFGQINYTIIPYEEQIKNIKYLTYLFYLYNKYYKLVPIDKLLILYCNKNSLLLILDSLFLMNIFEKKLLDGLHKAIINFRREPRIVSMHY